MPLRGMFCVQNLFDRMMLSAAGAQTNPRQSICG